MKNWQKTLLASVIFALSTTSTLVHANTPEQQLQQAIAFLEKGDYQAAFPILKQLAEQGVSVAQFNLGTMYYQGQGIKQNKATAKMWFGKACDNGDQGGCDGYRILNEGK